MRNGASKCEWHHAPEARGGFWDFEKSQLGEFGRGRLAFACSRRPWVDVAPDGGGRWKSQNRKIVSLSPYVEEPLNSKVIKSFVPEQRSRYVYFEFRDSYVLSWWTFDVRFTHSHIMAMVQLAVYKHVWRYFMPVCERIAFLVRLNLHI